jgi:hypothetical protein
MLGGILHSFDEMLNEVETAMQYAIDETARSITTDT